MSYSSSSKVEFCNHLGDDWRKLADYLEISPADQARFTQGDEGRGIWAWLENHKCLDRLPEALNFIRRPELATTLVEQQRASAKSYYASRIAQWSDARFALDQRFVQLTLLLDQGEAATGPRWQAAERFQNLHEVLAKVPDPALVLLGPPGSGKSTLLRHYELDCARAVLNGAAGDDLS
jgi:predicted NACHT family NTPase